MLRPLNVRPWSLDQNVNRQSPGFSDIDTDSMLKKYRHYLLMTSSSWKCEDFTELGICSNKYRTIVEATMTTLAH